MNINLNGFEDINESLKSALEKFKDEYNCQYIAFFKENTDTKDKLYWTSDEVWSHHFIHEDYYSKCHLVTSTMRMLDDRNKILLPWDSIKPSSKIEMKISNERREHNIDHGISYASKVGNVRQGIAFATKTRLKPSLNFARNINDNTNIVSQQIMEINNILKAHESMPSTNFIKLSNIL